MGNNKELTSQKLQSIQPSYIEKVADAVRPTNPNLADKVLNTDDILTLSEAEKAASALAGVTQKKHKLNREASNKDFEDLTSQVLKRE